MVLLFLYIVKVLMIMMEFDNNNIYTKNSVGDWCCSVLLGEAHHLITAFHASSTISTEEESRVRKTRSMIERASVWNTDCSGGKYTTSSWPNRDPPTAYKNMRLVKRPTDRTDLVCGREGGKGVLG